MTEEEGMESSDPSLMLACLRGKVGVRKLRLFAVACCRLAGHLVERSPDLLERDQNTLAMAEEDADEELNNDERMYVWWDACENEPSEAKRLPMIRSTFFGAALS